MYLFAFILSVFFPGLGQVLLSRYLKGLLIFFSIIILLDLSFIIFPFTLSLPAYILHTIYYILIGIYLFNLWDIFNIVYYRNRKSLREKKETLLRQGIKYYLQNDLYAAQRGLKSALKLDNDDIDIIYYLSRIAKTLGETGREKQLLNRLALLDFDKKWIQ